MSFIDFRASTPFTLVEASVVFHYVRQRRARHQLNQGCVLNIVVSCDLGTDLDSVICHGTGTSFTRADDFKH